MVNNKFKCVVISYNIGDHGCIIYAGGRSLNPDYFIYLLLKVKILTTTLLEKIKKLYITFYINYYSEHYVISDFN
jgi:hypothetical protein